EGDTEIDDGAGEAERLATAQLIAPGLVRAGLLAARKTARAAAVGQLPGKKKGRIVVIDGAPRHCIRNRRGSGETDVGLRHHLLGNVLELGRLPDRLVERRRGDRLGLRHALRGLDRLLLRFAHGSSVLISMRGPARACRPYAS